MLAWLIAAIIDPDTPHPILSLFGEQGTGKSTASRRIVEVIDPSPVPLRKPPRDPERWVTAAQGSWVVGLDNLSRCPTGSQTASAEPPPETATYAEPSTPTLIWLCSRSAAASSLTAST